MARPPVVPLAHARPDHAGGAAQVARETGTAFGIHAQDAAYAREGTSTPREESLRLGRLRVVHTPGHSPGHCSFLHEGSCVLVTGDAIFNMRGLRWPIGTFCTNFVLTTRTARRLAGLDHSVAAFTHGPELGDNPRTHVGRFLAGAGAGRGS